MLCRARNPCRMRGLKTKQAARRTEKQQGSVGEGAGLMELQKLKRPLRRLPSG